MYTLLCEDSISGVFSAVYEAWAGGYDRQEVIVRTGAIGNYELFMEYRQVETDIQRAKKVSDTLKKRFGEQTYETICYALWSDGEDKADAVYRMIRLGIEQKFGYHLHHHLTDASVERVFELQRAVFNEYDHLRGFIRFAELQGDMLYAKITPKHYQLDTLAVHFADRLPAENWLIHDINRKKAAIHQSYGGWLVTDEQSVSHLISREHTDTEGDFQEMWKRFLAALTIEARENLNLQRQNLPLRFRGNMIQ